MRALRCVMCQLARPQLIRRAMSSGAEYEPRMAQTSWGKTILNTPLLGQAVKLFADGYAGIVASELKKYGLRHQDVLVVTKDVVETLDRMPKAELDMRNKRLKRAADLSLKHTYLPYDLQEAHDPWADYSKNVSPRLPSIFLTEALTEALTPALHLLGGIRARVDFGMLLRSDGAVGQCRGGALGEAGDWQGASVDVALAHSFLPLSDAAAGGLGGWPVGAYHLLCVGRNLTTELLSLTRTTR
jgi:hypothetical protein